MSMTDSTQLGRHVVAGLTVEIDAPMVRAHSDDAGVVSLFIGPLLLTMSATDAATMAASLASVAATAMVNQTLKLVTDK